MIKRIVFLLWLISHTLVFSATCPDPNTSSLQWGRIPTPWIEDPFSEHRPQGEHDTQFVRASILVAGLGRGVACYYRNSLGYYSIWWPTAVHIPSRCENLWRVSLQGYECTSSLDACVFYTESD